MDKRYIVDGDALGAKILLSNKLSRWANNFEPHHNIPEVGVHKIGGMLHLPNTTILSVANYLNKDEDSAEHCDVFDEIVEVDLDMTKQIGQ